VPQIGPNLVNLADNVYMRQLQKFTFTWKQLAATRNGMGSHTQRNAAPTHH
jgi:hypothetical protein